MQSKVGHPILLCAAALFLVAASASAQRHKLSTINAETDEGKVLQSIGQETDASKRIGFMEDFATKYPKHDSTAWVLAQLQAANAKSGNSAKAVERGTRSWRWIPWTSMLLTRT